MLSQVEQIHLRRRLVSSVALRRILKITTKVQISTQHDGPEIREDDEPVWSSLRDWTNTSDVRKLEDQKDRSS